MNDDDFNNINSGDQKVWLMEGLYPALLVKRWMKHYVFKGKPVEKFVTEWKVFYSPDLNSFVILPRYYNVERDKAKRLQFWHHHPYRHDWVRANNNKLPLEWHRLPPEKFEGRLMLVRVVNVKVGQDGPIPSSLEYSRIKRIERPIEDGEIFERLPL